MKKTTNRRVVAGACLLLVTSSLRAQVTTSNAPITSPTNQPTSSATNTIALTESKPNKAYAIGGIGPSVMEDLTIRNAGNAKNEVDVGYRLSVGIGYHLTRHFDLGFETGATGNWLNTDSSQPLGGFSEGYLYQVPMLVTVGFQLPLGDRLTPYASVGAGGVASTLYLRSPFGGHNWDSDFTAAFQAAGGLKFSLDDHMSIGLEYKFLASGNHSWFDSSSFLFLQTGDIFSHSILATFTWTF